MLTIGLKVDGNFWLRDRPEERLAGSYLPDEGLVRLTGGELVECMTVIEQSPTSVTQVMRSDTNLEYDLLGTLDDGSLVTLLNATRGACSHGPSGTTQDFLFLYAVEGAHVDLDTRYVSAGATYEGLDLANSAGIINVPSIGPVELGLDDAFVFSLAAGLSYGQLERHVVGPFSTSLTFLVGSIVGPARLVLQTESGTSVSLRRRLRDHTLTPSHAFIEPSWLSSAAIDTWYRIWDRLIPVPSVIAKTIARDDLDVELRVLTLAASAEAIHRELYDHETMTKAEARAVRGPALKAVPAEAKARVEMLLSNLRELTYAERLRELADGLGALGDEVAGCTASRGVQPSGRESWIAAVKEARNGFAHQARRSPEDIREYSGRMFTLYESLRWFTSAVVLSEMGVVVSDITSLFKRSSAYHLFRERALHHWPGVYEVTAEEQ